MEIFISAVIAFLVTFIMAIRINKKTKDVEALTFLSIIGCVLFVVSYFSVIVVENININKNNYLDNSNKYILNKEVLNEIKGYYEIDFEKEEIIYRDNTLGILTKNEKRVKKEYYNTVKNIIEDVIRNEKNSSKEKNIFYTSIPIYCTYNIETYNNKVYYINDVQQFQQLDQALNNIEYSSDKNFVFYFVIISIILVIGCTFASSILNVKSTKRQTMEVEATIVDIKVMNYENITIKIPIVKYNINGVEYIETCSTGMENPVIDEKVTICVNQNNPKEITLYEMKEEKIRVNKGIVIACIAFVLIVIFLALFAYGVAFIIA